MSATAALLTPEFALQEAQSPIDASPWKTIVWNDPVNLMPYVTYVFQRYFGYSLTKAEKLMLQVHEKGQAVVSSGARERMELDVQAMHSYGLWATLSGPTDDN